MLFSRSDPKSESWKRYYIKLKTMISRNVPNILKNKAKMRSAQRDSEIVESIEYNAKFTVRENGHLAYIYIYTRNRGGSPRAAENRKSPFAPSCRYLIVLRLASVRQVAKIDGRRAKSTKAICALQHAHTIYNFHVQHTRT